VLQYRPFVVSPEPGTQCAAICQTESNGLNGEATFSSKALRLDAPSLL